MCRRVAGTGGMLWIAAWWCATCAVLSAQQEPEPTSAQPPAETQPAESQPAESQPAESQPAIPLYQQDPHDLITLDERHGSEVIKVKPIEFTGTNTRYAHNNHRLSDKLVVEVVSEPGKKFEILWRHIASIDLFETMVLREAEQLVSQSAVDSRGRDNGKLDEAYPYYDFLLAGYPDMPGLKESLQYYRFMNAATLYQQQRFAEALSMLEDVHAENPQFTRGTATVGKAMSGAIHQLMTQYVGKQDYFHARKLLKRLNDSYDGRTIPAIASWREQFEQRAAMIRDAARRQLDNGQPREAHRLCREMLEIWPDVAGGAELVDAIGRAYPLIIVGVYDPALTYDPSSLHNWGARRAGRIIHRTLMQYTGIGPSGGEYECTLGTVEVSEDRQQVRLNLNAQAQASELTAFDVSNRLLAMTRTDDPNYVPAWSALMEGARINNVNQIEIIFRRPFVLPEALMQIPLGAGQTPAEDQPSAALPAAGSGPYGVVSRQNGEALYAVSDQQQVASTHRPVEILERYFSQPEDAITALQRGEIDMIDRLAPSDVGRFADDTSFLVQRYALPTIHALVPSKPNPFLEKTGFRRGLAYAINRQLILNRGILRELPVEGCRPISGPFIAGVDPNDASSYAYDQNVAPFDYDPVLGKILLELTLQELIVTAEKQKQQAPTEIPPLLIGYPAREGPRIACRLIREQLQALGLVVELKEFAPGVTTDANQECDLVYTELFMWEPIVDARRLLGDEGLAPAHNYYVDLALQDLDVAKSWKDARDRLNDLHRYAHNEAVVIPLWQVAEHFVYHQRLRGLGKAPAYLYQDILQWRLVPSVVEAAQR